MEKSHLNKPKKKSILAVGPLNSAEYNFYSGQASMFEGFVDYLSTNRNYNIDVINIAYSYRIIKRKFGTFTLSRCIEYVYILFMLITKMIKHKYNVLYITTAQSKVGFLRDFFIIRLAFVFNIRIVAHQFGANYKGFLDSVSPLMKKVVKNTLENISVIIVEGQFMQDQFCFLNDYENKIKIVNNGLPGPVIDLSYKEKVINNNHIELLYLSNMIISKGYLDVLFAVEELANRHRIDLHCTFAGRFINAPDDVDLSGGMSPEEYFVSYIEKYSLNRYITRIDGLYGDEKREAFLRSHIFLLPTYFIYEGQPVSVIEAMAYGNVPIVTNYRHIPSMVNLDNGFYVNPKSYMEIVNVILKLYSNHQEYSLLSRRNIEKYLKHFTFEQYCKNVLYYLTY